MPLRWFLFFTFSLAVFASCYDKDIEGPEPVSAFSVSTSVPTLNLRPDDVSSFTVAVRNETRGQAVSAIGTFAESTDPAIVRVETTSRPDSFKVTAIDGGTARIIVGFNGSTPTARDTIVVTNAPRPVARVALTPDSTGVFVGATTTLRAPLLDAAGDTIRQRAASFRIDPVADTTIATVSSTGVVTGRRVGAVRVIASREGVEDTSRVTVTLRPVTTVTVTPNPATVRVGNTLQLSAELRGGTVVITGRPITWSSADTTKVTVNSSGVIRGIAVTGANAVLVSATSEGRTGSTRVLVDP